jgi:hypothetical protein
MLLSVFRNTHEWSPSVWSMAATKRCTALAHKNATAALPPNHREPQTSPIRRQLLRGLSHPPCAAKLPPAIQGAAGASCNAAFERPERERGSAEHGMAAQPFTPNPNVSSSPASNPSLKAVDENIRKPESTYRVTSKPSVFLFHVVCDCKE